MMEMTNDFIFARTERLRRELRAAGADAFVALNDEDSNWESLYYLSGFRGTAGAVIVYANSEPELILDARYAEMGGKSSPHLVLEQRHSLVEDTADRLRLHEACDVLCEAARTSHLNWRLISTYGSWADGGDMMSRLRRFKDASETAAIRRAARIASDAFLETLDSVKPGMTEKEFEALLNYRISVAGGEPSFDMIVASGERSSMPHGRASGREMRPGEWVTVDYGARWEGLCCDITRNFSLGTPSDEAAEMHELVTEAHRTGASLLRPGASGKAVHEAAVEIFGRHGKAKYFTHSLGHGLGLEIHEAPLLSARRDDTLAAGDVVTVEPGLYIPHFGGMRLEDDYLITEGGAERLTEMLDQQFYTVSV